MLGRYEQTKLHICLCEQTSHFIQLCILIILSLFSFSQYVNLSGNRFLFFGSSFILLFGKLLLVAPKLKVVSLFFNTFNHLSGIWLLFGENSLFLLEMGYFILFFGENSLFLHEMGCFILVSCFLVKIHSKWVALYWCLAFW